MHVLGCSCVDLDGDDIFDILWSKQRVHVFKQSNVPWQIVIYKKLVDQEYRVTLYICMFLIVRSVRLCPSDITGVRGAYRPKLPVFFWRQPLMRWPLLVSGRRMIQVPPLFQGASPSSTILIWLMQVSPKNFGSDINRNQTEISRICIYETIYRTFVRGCCSRSNRINENPSIIISLCEI